MRRREFIRSVIALGGGLAAGQAFSQQSPTPDGEVKRVLVMFKCHFDAGFIDTQAAVVRRYFTEFFPQAIKVAEEMRQSGSCRYVWTTGSWLLYEYLEQASPTIGGELNMPFPAVTSPGMLFPLVGKPS